MDKSNEEHFLNPRCGYPKYPSGHPCKRKISIPGKLCPQHANGQGSPLRGTRYQAYWGYSEWAKAWDVGLSDD